MSEGMDAFVAGTVLPAFTPTLGLFLAISTAYGLWKVHLNVLTGQGACAATDQAGACVAKCWPSAQWINCRCMVLRRA